MGSIFGKEAPGTSGTSDAPGKQVQKTSGTSEASGTQQESNRVPAEKINSLTPVEKLKERLKILSEDEGEALVKIIKSRKIQSHVVPFFTNEKAILLETLKNMLNLFVKIDDYYENIYKPYQQKCLESFISNFIEYASKFTDDQIKRRNNVILSLTKNNWKETTNMCCKKGKRISLGFLFREGSYFKTSNNLLTEENLKKRLYESNGGSRTKRMRYNKGSRRNKTMHRQK
uniref:Uncharacterized protein n=1 Tax=viral metagenome TaxID=1070528 RepID=A0A6C0D2S4_9ZZZZ